ncbi:putative polysaccharide biosynthesis protein [Fructobacillus ficulneus]|uniref:Polysaccharide transport membrane protein n=1 Tax=Fructobacillus ficulneus TaxID=157463 RepID=A0A0K8MJ17_9LACO|nr:polysaccharide biosynthesis protein [Fructobacillus ficulneus]GAP00557.1 polysaccharide transport membrane protein [Fructobacillus ficulneus]
MSQDSNQNQEKKQGPLDRSALDNQLLTADELLAKLEVNLRPKSRRAKSFGKSRLNKPYSKKQSWWSFSSEKKARQKASKDLVKRQETRQKNQQDWAASQGDEVTTLADEAVASFGQSASDSQALDQSQGGGNNALVRGSFWLSLGNIVSRLLGAVYILPWLAMLGQAANQGNALFSQGYNIYAILLSIATFGFPSAISKVMAQLIAKKDQKGLWSLTIKSLQIGVILGIVFSILLYVAAPALSNGNSAVVPVLHSLAPAVLIFPVMSMIRGIFQGHQLMHISAMSDIFEQVGRVIYLLGATWLVLSHDSSNWTGAVVQSTFAAFIGALFSMAVLGYGWVRYARLIHPVAGVPDEQAVLAQRSNAGRSASSDEKTPEPTAKALDLVWSILKESWPFVVIGSSTNLFLFVDQYTYFPLMKTFFHSTANNLQIQFALFSANPNKLVMIVISFATSIAATALPILAAKKAAGNAKELKEQLVAVLRLTSLVLIPSALGMYAIADPLYRFFYPIDHTVQEGVYLLQFSAFLTVIMSFFMLLAFILQALSHGTEVMRAFGWGFLIKLIVQAPLIYLFQGMGALIATALGLGWSLILMMKFLKREYHVSLGTIRTTMTKTYVAAIIMAIVAFAVSWLSTHYLLAATSKIGAGLATALGVGAGLVVLVILYKKMGLLRQVLARGQK